MQASIFVLLTLPLFGSIVGCGSSNFGGSSGGTTSNPGKSTEVPKSENSEALKLTWEFGCKMTDSDIKRDDKGYHLKGPGPHELDPKYLDGATLNINGDTCGASSVARDVIFVVDVSGSMITSGGLFRRGTDPKVNGTCARMAALSQVIQAIKDRGPARFGIVTFEGSSAPKKRSTKMFTNVAELYTDLKGTASSIEDVICAGYDATNYDAGLTGAKDLFAENPEASSSKEIYFISDGQPEPSTANGKTIAAELRSNATIATVMVGGSNDSVLKNGIASKDRFGEPLHARAEYSSKLAEVLARLASNNIVEANATIFADGSKLSSVDFSDKLSGLNFDFDVYQINTGDAPHGITVELNYRDKFGEEHKDVGELKWKSAE